MSFVPVGTDLAVKLFLTAVPVVWYNSCDFCWLKKCDFKKTYPKVAKLFLAPKSIKTYFCTLTKKSTRYLLPKCTQQVKMGDVSCPAFEFIYMLF
jgi:hypothetical protein